ncbi:HTH-type transcriptional regulator AlkS [Trichinella pseudospiralis]
MLILNTVSLLIKEFSTTQLLHCYVFHTLLSFLCQCLHGWIQLLYIDENKFDEEELVSELLCKRWIVCCLLLAGCRAQFR